MAGNVEEWCANGFTVEQPVRDGTLLWPTTSQSGRRTTRGASWRSRSMLDALSRRVGRLEHTCSEVVGFRLARSVDDTTE